ncbi:hypothetical protein [Paenibacillus arenilitoris]|uniref:Uncharacterized protein n=1 Tax=Paenibacillus arenilitoris TaxID=2772299 RepID=A0A927CPE5_9BACL|nr:hypothetical protein [Paenibacillus arenilitoris]MBD2869290.1 hypothetical protein [Paenibacillus arenilitoris]
MTSKKERSKSSLSLIFPAIRVSFFFIIPDVIFYDDVNELAERGSIIIGGSHGSRICPVRDLDPIFAPGFRVPVYIIGRTQVKDMSEVWITIVILIVQELYWYWLIGNAESEMDIDLIRIFTGCRRDGKWFASQVRRQVQRIIIEISYPFLNMVNIHG